MTAIVEAPRPDRAVDRRTGHVTFMACRMCPAWWDLGHRLWPEPWPVDKAEGLWESHLRLAHNGSEVTA